MLNRLERAFYQVFQQRHHFKRPLVLFGGMAALAIILTACNNGGERTLTVIVDPRGSGAIDTSPSKPLYEKDERVRVTAIPTSGCRFVEWRGDLQGTLNPEVITMDSKKVVRGVFECSTNGPPTATPVPPTPTTDPGQPTSTARPETATPTTLTWTIIEGRTIIDPEGKYWEKYQKETSLPGLYLQLKDLSQFVQAFGDYLELRPDGSFELKEGGKSISGQWRDVGNEVVLNSIP